MVRSEKREKWIIYTAAVLLCLVLASFWLMSNIYAKYATEASGSDEARVALWGNSQSIALSPDNSRLPQVPGETCTYTLIVSNKNENGKISEVTQKYGIEVVTSGNLPLKYTISEKGTQIGQEFQETAQTNTWKISEANMVFQAGVEDSHTYTLTVTWPEGKNSASLAGIPDSIQINICAEQVD